MPVREARRARLRLNRLETNIKKNIQPESWPEIYSFRYANKLQKTAPDAVLQPLIDNTLIVERTYSSPPSGEAPEITKDDWAAYKFRSVIPHETTGRLIGEAMFPYLFSGGSFPGLGFEIGISSILNDYDETALTWNNRNDLSLGSQVVIDSYGAPIALNSFSSAVQITLDENTYGILIRTIALDQEDGNRGFYITQPFFFWAGL